MTRDDFESLLLSIGLLSFIIFGLFSGFSYTLRNNRAKSYCLQETGETYNYIVHTGRRAYDIFCYEEHERVFAYSEYDGEQVTLEE